MPGLRSTPELTSMPNGRTRAMASATFVALSPPANIEFDLRCEFGGCRPVADPPGAAHRALEQYRGAAECAGRSRFARSTGKRRSVRR